MISGDCCWRRTKSIASPERSFWSHSPVLIGASTSLPTGDYLKNIQKLLILKYCFFFLDTQLHIGREELYHYFPPPNRLHNTFPQGQARKRGKSWLKCSRQRVDLKKKGEKKNLQGFFYEMLLPILVTHSTSVGGHYDSKKHEFQLPSSFLPTILVRRNYA